MNTERLTNVAQETQNTPVDKRHIARLIFTYVMTPLIGAAAFGLIPMNIMVSILCAFGVAVYLAVD